MEKTPCGRCHGSGRYSWNARDGSVCYGCWGTGHVANQPRRKATHTPPRALPAMRTIASICGGDPTKLNPANSAALDYLGLTPALLAEYAQLWRQGTREIVNPQLMNKAGSR